MAERVKRDPLRGLSLLARAFVLSVMAVLAIIFCLAIYAVFFVDLGPLSQLLSGVFIVVFLAAMGWLQWSFFPRTMKDAAEWQGGPLLRTLMSTLGFLEDKRRGKRGSSDQDRE